MKFVFCEGKDDVAVVQELVKHLNLDIRVEQYGGKNSLSIFLESITKRPEFAQQKVISIGILRDADENADNAFASVRDALTRNNFSAPGASGAFSGTSPIVGIFIVGLNGKGMIEDLCLASVNTQPGFNCVDAYFKCVVQNSERKQFSSKAKVRVWMASQTDYEYHVGKAAEHGYWNWENPVFDPLKNFLKTL